MTTTQDTTTGSGDTLRLDEQIALEAGELPAMEHLGTGEVGIKDRTNMADYIAAVAANTRTWLLMDPSAAALYDAGVALVDRGQPLGYILQLDALIAAPEAVQAMLQCVRRELVACVPGLALMAPMPPEPSQNAPEAPKETYEHKMWEASRRANLSGTPGSLQWVTRLDTADYMLNADGSLTIDQRFDGQPLLHLTQREAHDLQLFFQQRQVIELTETAERRRQQETWDGWLNDPETAAARAKLTR